MQKLKIGVFGDSFAQHTKDFEPHTSWVDLLSQDFDVTNFGLNESSTYYSYCKFLETHHRFDRIVFLLVDPVRVHTSFLPIYSELMILLHLERTKFSDDQKKVLKGLALYFKDSINDIEIQKQYHLFHDLMINDLQEKRKDILFLPSSSKKNDSNLLVDITLNENSYWQLGENIAAKLDTRQCHMSNPANHWLYERIKENLVSSTRTSFFSFDLNEVPLPDNVNNYMIRYEDICK